MFNALTKKLREAVYKSVINTQIITQFGLKSMQLQNTDKNKYKEKEHLCPCAYMCIEKKRKKIP